MVKLFVLGLENPFYGNIPLNQHIPIKGSQTV